MWKKSFICYFKIIYSVIVNVVWFVIFFLGSKPRTKPKRQPPTKEEKTFKRRAKYFVIAQLVAVVLFVSVLSGYRNNAADMELDNDDLGYEWKYIHLFIFSMTKPRLTACWRCIPVSCVWSKYRSTENYHSLQNFLS